MKNKTLDEAKKTRDEAWKALEATPEYKDYKGKTKALEATPAYKTYKEANKAWDEAEKAFWKALDAKDKAEDAHWEKYTAHEKVKIAWAIVEGTPEWQAKVEASKAMKATPEYKDWEKATEAQRENKG